MMIRPLVLLLLALNLGFLAWNLGWIEQLGGQANHAGREPERLKQQLAPDSVKVVLPTAQVLAAVQAPPVCLESPRLLGEDRLRAAVTALEQAGVPAKAFTEQRTSIEGVWAVATTPLPSRNALTRKEDMFKRLRVTVEPLKASADEETSLLVSRHASADEAEKAMDALTRRFVKGLRVVVISPPASTYRLRFEQADADLQGRLAKLADSTLGGAFARCEAAAEAASAASR